MTSTACQTSDVIYVPTDNTAASCTEAIRNVVEVEKVPVVAGEEGICSGCGVTTLSISYYELGRAAGEQAFNILVNGADPATTPIFFFDVSQLTLVVNEQNAAELGITIPEELK